jgi:Mn-dependent DtxR family transcriptional regulator
VLIERGGRVTTGQVEKVLKVSKPTALHEMQTMKILGICEEWDPDDLTTEKGIQFHEDFMWFSSDECRSHFKWNTGSEPLNSNTE